MKANRIVKFSMYLFVLLLLCFTSDLQNEWILSRWGSLIINFSNYLKDNEKVNLLLSIGVLLVTLFSSWSNSTNYSKRWHLGGFVLVIDCLLFLSTKHWTWSNSSNPSTRGWTSAVCRWPNCEFCATPLLHGKDSP